MVDKSPDWNPPKKKLPEKPATETGSLGAGSLPNGWDSLQLGGAKTTRPTGNESLLTLGQNVAGLPLAPKQPENKPPKTSTLPVQNQPTCPKFKHALPPKGVNTNQPPKVQLLVAQNETGPVSDTGGTAIAPRVFSNHDHASGLGKAELSGPDDSGKRSEAMEPNAGTDNLKPNATEDQLDDYLCALGQRESSGKYDEINTAGYLGKYQMGSGALDDVGYMKNGKWTGKDGIANKEDFLHSPAVQEKAIREFVSKQWEYAKEEGLDKYVGKTIKGIKITKSGIIAAVHLKGAKGAKPFFATNGEEDPTDGFKTPVSEYIKKMEGFNLPFTEKKPK